MAKIFVTGAAGYIGSIMVPRLLAAGHAVLALDNFMYRQTSLLECCANPGFELVRGDCRDRDLLAKCLKDVDAVFPLACLTGAPVCSQDPVGATTVIRDAVRDLLKLRSRSQAIIFPTTNSGYGVGEKDKFCTEETPLRPVSLYGRLKVEIEQDLLAAENTLTLRLATIFGASPRMRTDLLVNDFVFRAVNDRFIVLFEGDFKRNYLHVRDAADAFLFSLQNFSRMKGGAYNVGLSEANVSKRELCEEIKRHVPDLHITEHALGKDPDKRDYIVSNAKIETAGFKATRTLSQGIVELIKACRLLPKFSHGNV